MHFDWTLSLGNVITAGAVVFAFVIAVVIDRERIRALHEWMRQHDIEAQARDDKIGKLALIAERLKTLSEQTERRLVRLER